MFMFVLDMANCFLRGWDGLGFGAFIPALNAYVVDDATPVQRTGGLTLSAAFKDIRITAGTGA